MPPEIPKRGRLFLVRPPSSLSRREFEAIERTIQRYDVVRHYLRHGRWVVARLIWRDPAVATGVLRVLWQRRKLARALRRRGLPPWLASKQ